MLKVIINSFRTTGKSALQPTVKKDVFSIPQVTEEELQNIYGHGNNKGLRLDEVSSKAFKPAAKIRPISFIKTFKLCMAEEVFPASGRGEGCFYYRSLADALHIALFLI